MELKYIKQYKQNILHWYPVEKNKTVLQVGMVDPEIINELCKKFQNVTVLVDNEEKNEIQRAEYIEHIKSVEIINHYNQTQYDYVSLIGTIEYNASDDRRNISQSLEKLIDIGLKFCKKERKNSLKCR